MKIKLATILFLTLFLAASSGHAQNRRVYEGVVDMKLKTIGTLILMEVNGNKVGGWIRLGKFAPIDGGTVSEDVTEFRAAGNTYRIDEKKERISIPVPMVTGKAK